MMRAALTALLFLALPAEAMVIGGGIERQTGNGRFVILDPSAGFSVGADTFDTDHLYAFDEDQNILLPAPIRFDVGPGEDGAGGVIGEGEVVASHYVFFDSIDGAHIGWVDFDAPILGVAAMEPTLKATDFLANTNVIYLSPELRGLEIGDYVFVDNEEPTRLWVYWAGSSPGDYIRVFTAASPGV